MPGHDSHRRPTIAVVIPCFNEEKTVGRVVEDFLRVLPDCIVVIADNNSTDDTARAARAAGRGPSTDSRLVSSKRPAEPLVALGHRPLDRQRDAVAGAPDLGEDRVRRLVLARVVEVLEALGGRTRRRRHAEHRRRLAQQAGIAHHQLAADLGGDAVLQ